MVDLSSAAWRKSSQSNANGCVEVAVVDAEVAIRDSKDPDGPVLVFASHEWEAFLRAARGGQFELTTDRRRGAPGP
jgi:hypothetical protein